MVNWWIEAVNLGFGDEYLLHGERPNGEKFRIFIDGEQAHDLMEFMERQRDELQAKLWPMIGEVVP
jgi:hypothetical protein